MPLRVGLIGAGHIGGVHARAIHGAIRRELADAKYIAVADRQIDRAQRFAELAALPLVFADGHALIDQAEIDAVYICTPTREHRE
ncbi:MAG TPA: Gfo/Idh/MocA family oxidoreductase, partial [Dehalococcoidia bacterium]